VTLSETNQGTLSASAGVEMHMPYRIAGIDVHKAMLAVVVADVEVEGTGNSHGDDSAQRPASCAS
jgi:hypothetical protein